MPFTNPEPEAIKALLQRVKAIAVVGAASCAVTRGCALDSDLENKL